MMYWHTRWVALAGAGANSRRRLTARCLQVADNLAVEAGHAGGGALHLLAVLPGTESVLVPGAVPALHVWLVSAAWVGVGLALHLAGGLVAHPVQLHVNLHVELGGLLLSLLFDLHQFLDLAQLQLAGLESLGGSPGTSG